MFILNINKSKQLKKIQKNMRCYEVYVFARTPMHMLVVIGSYRMNEVPNIVFKSGTV